MKFTLLIVKVRAQFAGTTKRSQGSAVLQQNRIRTHRMGVERAGANAEAMRTSREINLKDLDVCIA